MLARPHLRREWLRRSSRLIHAEGRPLLAQVPVISIIDDDASIRGALQRFLRALGYLAHAFASAEDFLRSPQVADNSCLILDVRMPEMSGLELQKQLQIQGTQVPIIFITSVQDQSIRTQALNAGAVCVLTKPFEIRTLIKHLEDALKRRPIAPTTAVQAAAQRK